MALSLFLSDLFTFHCSLTGTTIGGLKMWFSFMSFSFIFDCKANLLKWSLKALDGVLSNGFRFWRKFSKSRRPPAESAFFSQRSGRWTVLWTCWHFVFYKKMLFKITRSSFKKFLKFRLSEKNWDLEFLLINVCLFTTFSFFIYVCLRVVTKIHEASKYCLVLSGPFESHGGSN